MNGSVAHSVASLALVLAMATTAVSCLAPGPRVDEVSGDDFHGPDCCSELFNTLGPLDVAIVIDTSYSSVDPSGIDVDRDGIVGRLVQSTYTDPDDSQLAAIVASVLRLLEEAADHDIHFSLLTFSGRSVSIEQQPQRGILNRDARILVELTDDISEVAAGLDLVLKGGSRGTSNYFAGMQGATRSLVETKDRERVSRRVALFISDSPAPLISGVEDNFFSTHDARLKTSARKAIRHRISYNTFGLSEDASKWRRRPLGLIAGATGGTYHAVQDASQLYCHLVDSLTIGSVFASDEME